MPRLHRDGAIWRSTMELRAWLFICLLLCLSCIVTGQVSMTCRPNERFLSCGSCQRTCRNPVPDCVSICRTGCYCPEDQVRNDTGHCVKLSECPPVSPHKLYTSEPHFTETECPEDEEYRFCEPCNRTCDNPNPICPAQCGRGCFCKEDLFRNRDGRCVSFNKCYRKSESSNFIKPAYELTCGPHQVYNSCRLCESTCSSATPVCRTSCVAGCFCEPGYLKSPSGECVLLKNCPKAEITLGGIQEPTIEDCSSDEIYLSCGWCEPSCWEPRPECPLGICTRGCLCRPPLLRHHSGHCVEEKDCAPQKCTDPDEEFVCRYGCEARCGSMKCNVRPRRCVLGCHCKLGLLRDDTGKCVTSEQCKVKPQNNVTNVTHALEVSFLLNGKKRQRDKFIFDYDSPSTEDSGDTITNFGKSADTNNLLKNMNTEQSLPNGRLGVFPPVFEKTSDSKRYFEEISYNYSRFVTTPKPVFEAHTVNSNKVIKSMNPDLNYNTTSNIYLYKTTLDISRTTDEMALTNNTLNLPLYPILRQAKIDFLDKTTVNVESETNFKVENNVTDATNVNTKEQDEKTTANPSSTSTPTSSIKTFPVNNKMYLNENNDINPLKVPVNLRQHKPYKDVISRAVKYYKDFTASTPSPYLDMNMIRVPLSYTIGDNLHVLFSDNRKNQDKRSTLPIETSPTFTSFMEFPFSSISPKDMQHVKPSPANSHIFSLASSPFMKNRDIKSMREENMQDTIVNNILHAMRKILPTPVNLTILNLSK